MKLPPDEIDLFLPLGVGGGSLLEYKTFLQSRQTGCLHDSPGIC